MKTARMLSKLCWLIMGWSLAFLGMDCGAAERVNEISITESSPIPARLAAYRWSFIKANTADGQESTQIRQPDNWPATLQMGFSEDGHGGMSVCNSIGWRYTLTGDNAIRFDEIISTSMACVAVDGATPGQSNNVMDLETRVGRQLPNVRSFTIQLAQGSTPPLLTLKFEDGSSWNYSGTPTLRTKYGDDKRALVIEVGADLQPCGQHECLRVREVRWDKPNLSDPMNNAKNKELSVGLKEMITGVFEWSSVEDYSYAGPWQLLELDAIEGFKRKPGLRSLEYVDKYSLHHQPTGAPDTAYVHVGRMAPRPAP